jgi:hypothetical protein
MIGGAQVGANSAFSRPGPKIPKIDLTGLASNNSSSSNSNNNNNNNNNNDNSSSSISNSNKSNTHAALPNLGLRPQAAGHDPHAPHPHQTFSPAAVGNARPTRSDASPQATQNPGVAQVRFGQFLVRFCLFFAHALRNLAVCPPRKMVTACGANIIDLATFFSTAFGAT